MMDAIDESRRVMFGDAFFIPRCEKCGRYVRADEAVWINALGYLKSDCNATCSKCGRTHMIFEGFFHEEMPE